MFLNWYTIKHNNYAVTLLFDSGAEFNFVVYYSMFHMNESFSTKNNVLM